MSNIVENRTIHSSTRGNAQRGRRTNRPRNKESKKDTEVKPSVGSTPNMEASQSNNDPKQDITSEEDSPACWICAEPIKFYALSECNHRTCHVCSVRLRALYKKMDCTFCKVLKRIFQLFSVSKVAIAFATCRYFHRFF